MKVYERKAEVFSGVNDDWLGLGTVHRLSGLHNSRLGHHHLGLAGLHHLLATTNNDNGLLVGLRGVVLSVHGSLLLGTASGGGGSAAAAADDNDDDDDADEGDQDDDDNDGNGKTDGGVKVGQIISVLALHGVSLGRSTIVSGNING